MLNRNLSEARDLPLENSSIVQAGNRYFDTAIAPGITNQATLSGLGRSTANTNALAAAEAQTILPLLQGEQARRDAMINQGMTQGDVERSVEQQGYNADQNDYIRRQALSEQGLFAPLGQLPSTLGQSTKTTSSGGGGLTVICTELYRQGLMDEATFEADTEFGNQLPRSVIRGYHLWAAPMAKLMHKSKLLTRLIAPIGLAWAREMKRRVTGEGEGSILGAAILAIGVPTCRMLGQLSGSNDNSPQKVKFRQDILKAERWMEQVSDGRIHEECQLTHHFTPVHEKYGCCAYAREIFLPKGSIVVGKIHKHRHLNFVMKGKVSVATEFGKKFFTAPCIFVSEVGLKRAVYAEEDTTWVTVHLTEHFGESQLGEIENEVIAKNYEELGLVASIDAPQIGERQ